MKRLAFARALLALALLLPLPAWADFVVDNTSLPSSKTNLRPLPQGADPTKYLQASDYNALMNAALDLRHAVVAGKYLGLSLLASDPTPTNATTYVWAKTDFGLHLHINAVDNQIAYGPVTTKGDLLCFDGSHFRRLAIGTDGWILTADSTQSCGIKWAAGASLSPPVVIEKDNIGFAQDETLQLKNVTAAAAGLVQNSPGLVLRNEAWDTGSLTSKTIKFMWQSQGQETNPASGYLALMSSVNGGAYSLRAAFSDAGDFGVLGNVTGANGQFTHLLCQGSPPAATGGSGAGANPTIVITGNDCEGLIDLTTDVGTNSNAAIVTLTFNTAFAHAPAIVVTAANDNAGSYNFNAWYFVTSTASSWTLMAGTHAALTGVTQYKWFYHVLGN